MYWESNDYRKQGLIYNGRHLPYNPKLRKRAIYFRDNLTKSEKKFWFNFCKLNEYRWRTQVIIDNYIVDFYCPKLKLVIEIDGLEHSRKYNKEYDAVRDDILKSYGLKVIRIENINVNHEFNKCRTIIQQEIKIRISELNINMNNV